MPIRDILVVTLVGLLAVYAFKRPYFGAVLWVWLGVMNPHRLGWGFAYSLPFAQLAAGVTLLSIFLNRKQARWPAGAPLNWMLLLAFWMAITSLSAFIVDHSVDRYVDFLKVVLMTLAVGAVMRTREQVVGMIWVIAVSLGFYGIKGGIFTIATGGAHRVWGPTSSFIQGNNELAVGLIMTIPLMYFLVQESAVAAQWPGFKRLGEKWIRRGLYAAMGLSAIAAIGSQSRGALLAIIAMGSVLWWRSKSKLPIALAAVGFGALVLVAAPDTWFERMDTIRTYEEDASAMGRINAWTMAVNIANDRITGAGFAFASPFIYQMYAPDPSIVLVAHSIYFQVLGEHGYIGLILFLSMWISAYRVAGYIVKAGKGVDDLAWAVHFGNLAKVSMVGFAVGGAFLDLAYWEMPYYLIAALVAAKFLVNEHLKSVAPQTQGGMYFSGLARGAR